MPNKAPMFLPDGMTRPDIAVVVGELLGRCLAWRASSFATPQTAEEKIEDCRIHPDDRIDIVHLAAGGQSD